MVTGPAGQPEITRGGGGGVATVSVQDMLAACCNEPMPLSVTRITME